MRKIIAMILALFGALKLNLQLFANELILASPASGSTSIPLVSIYALPGLSSSVSRESISLSVAPFILSFLDCFVWGSLCCRFPGCRSCPLYQRRFLCRRHAPPFGIVAWLLRQGISSGRLFNCQVATQTNLFGLVIILNIFVYVKYKI